MYGIKKEVKLSYGEAVQKARDELQKEGFGVLTEIDIKAKLKEKLNVEFDNYIILGACNPALAHQALQKEQDLGLMLPCNMIVYEKDGKTFVSAIKPTVQMEKIGNKELDSVAKIVEGKLQKVVNNI